jgi:MFS family permease
VGDGFDGWGAGTDGLLMMLLGGIPLALTLFAIVTIVLYWRRKNPERQFRLRHFLLYGAGGILLGTVVGFLLIGFITDRSDQCHLLSNQRYWRNHPSLSEQERQEQFRSLNCVEVLENDKKVGGAVLASVVIVGLVAPSVGLWGGSRFMPRRRQSR